MIDIKMIPVAKLMRAESIVIGTGSVNPSAS